MLNSKGLYVITGGPGTGKTSLIEALERDGLKTIKEVARDIIKEQQQQAEKKEKELKEQYNQLRDNMGRQNTLIELATNQLPEQKTLSASLLKEDKEIYYPKIDLLLQNRFYTLHSIDNLKGELIKSQGGTRLNIQKKSESTRDKITKIMREYRYAFPFDALELAEDVEACAEYLNIYHRVVTEGLPAHEARLKAMLNQDTIQSIVTFDSKLDLQTDPGKDRHHQYPFGSHRIQQRNLY